MKLMVDLDGVLCDFEGQYETLFGKPFKLDTGKWKKITTCPTFWIDMPWMKDGKALWNVVSKLNPTILTAPCDSKSVKDKVAWCTRELGPKVPVIVEKDKFKYATPDTILIDDRTKNIDPWRAAGGIGILHTSTANTLNELHKYESELGMKVEAKKLPAKGTPDFHKHKIAVDTVKNPMKGKLLGGPSLEEAKKMLKEHFGYTDKDLEDFEVNGHTVDLFRERLNEQKGKDAQMLYNTVQPAPHYEGEWSIDLDNHTGKVRIQKTKMESKELKKGGTDIFRGSKENLMAYLKTTYPQHTSVEFIAAQTFKDKVEGAYSVEVVGVLTERVDPKTGTKKWALVSKDKSKVLKWFNKKPSKEAVQKEEARVSAFKHLKKK